jgi:nitrile hydratase accessory protein
VATFERIQSDAEGPAAVPRQNGELVFEAPWEGRAFCIAVALSDRRLYEWEEFRSRLIAEIADADACGAESTYYERWLAALERLLLAREVFSAPELDKRTAEYAAGERDDDDHEHDHDHDHDPERDDDVARA